MNNKNILFIFFILILVLFCTNNIKENFDDQENDEEDQLEQNVNVEEVNCDKDKELAKKFNVRAYPTVYLVNNDKKTELKEGISANSLEKLVKNNK